MSPTLKQIQTFTIKGFSTRTKNQDEFNPTTAKIPTLWKKFHESTLPETQTIYSVYSDYQSDANGFYNITVGSTFEDLKNELSTIIIQSGKYLVFPAIDQQPASVIETWMQIWNYFESESSYKRNFISDFESYINKNALNIHIGIE